MPENRNEDGFSLLECIIAIGILSVVLVQVLSIQSSSIAITQAARDNMQATWALKQMQSQVSYVLDTLGASSLPKEEVLVPWTLNPKFSMKYFFKPTEIKASQLLITAVKLGNAVQKKESEDPSKEEEDPAAGIKAFADQMDGVIPKDLYRAAQLHVIWNDGVSERKLEGGMLIIDDKALPAGTP